MKVKKVVTSILAMLVAGSVIAGCGGSGGDKKSADGKLDRSKQFCNRADWTYERDLFPHWRCIL